MSFWYIWTFICILNLTPWKIKETYLILHTFNNILITSTLIVNSFKCLFRQILQITKMIKVLYRINQTTLFVFIIQICYFKSTLYYWLYYIDRYQCTSKLVINSIPRVWTRRNSLYFEYTANYIRLQHTLDMSSLTFSPLSLFFSRRVSVLLRVTDLKLSNWDSHVSL